MNTLLSFVNLAVAILAGEALMLYTPHVNTRPVQVVLVILGIVMIAWGLWRFYTHPVLRRVGE